MERTFKSVLPEKYHNVCCYCGNLATHRDHFRPWSKFLEPWWLPACNLCNGSLQDAIHFTLADRCRQLHDGVVTRHSNVLDRNFDRLMQGTRGRLRQHLSDCRAKAAFLNMRLDWMCSMMRGKPVFLADLRPNTPDATALIEKMELAELDMKIKLIRSDSAIRRLYESIDLQLC